MLMYYVVQPRMVLVVNFFEIFKKNLFVVSICDLLHDVEAIHVSCKQHPEIFCEIKVMPVKLHILISPASLNFQKRFPDVVCT